MVQILRATHGYMRKSVAICTLAVSFLMVMLIIPPVARTHDQHLVSDKNFVFSSAFNHLDILQFLQEQKSGLAQIRLPFNGIDQSIADIIVFYAHYYSINPKILLTFIELQSGLVTNSHVPDIDTVNQAIGYPGQQDFAAQIDKLAQELVNTYYAHKNSANASTDNSATFAIRQVLNTLTNQSTNDIKVEENRFAQIFSTFFGNSSTNNLTRPVSVPPPPALFLPWQSGVTWYFTGGPHSFNGSGSRPWSSLDFAPGPADQSGCNWTSWSQVRPARSGYVIYAANNLVRIHHSDYIDLPAWQTSYYHIRSIQVTYGQFVSTATNLGYPSCESGMGGTSTGVHQHFSFLYDGEYQDVHNRYLSGWLIQETSHYNGTMSKSGTTKTASATKGDHNAITP